MTHPAFRLDPREHQLQSFEATKDKPAWGLFWTMGVGKTCPTIAKSGYLFEGKKIQAVVVFAPNGVHRNYINKELPKHLPDRIPRETYYWTSNKAKQKGNVREQIKFMEPSAKLKVLAVSYSAMRTDIGKAYVKAFMDKYTCFAVADESQFFKTPGAKITQTMLRSIGKRAKYRQILSGTPITKNPFDVYAQVRFVDDNFWAKHDLQPFAVFKQNFGIWVHHLPAPVGFRNKEQLSELLSTITHRLTLKSAGIDLPPITYLKREFDLTPKVRKVYTDLAVNKRAILPESGELVESQYAIAIRTKIQQVVCGYVAVDSDEPVQMIDSDRNPRLDLLQENVLAMPGKSIIWSKFTPDIDMIMAMLRKAGRNPVRYDGKVSDDDRERNIDLFMEGGATDFVAKPSAGGTGLTLTAATSIHNFANSYDYAHRAQGVARAYRFGLDHPLFCFDYVARDTVDEEIITNLREKHEISQAILQDEKEHWI